VAAALSYQDRQAIGQAQHILVFDLGGGTFDTTIVQIDGKEMTVIARLRSKLAPKANTNARFTPSRRGKTRP